MTDRRALPNLTIVALAHNEARHIRSCFRSFGPLTARPDVSTLIVLDSRADAETTRVAEETAERVVTSRFVNFSQQRNRGLDEATSEWVFFVDPDERCTPALAREIAEAIESNRNAAYRVPRRNILFGHEVRHTGWWPDYQIRLLRRELCRYDESREVHEVPQVLGEIGTLPEPLIHYNYETRRQFIRKQWAYASYDARALYLSGRRANPRNMLGQSLREFKRRFIEYDGYRDGLLGFSLSVAMMLYTAETYRRLLLLQRRAGN